ncbi:hypothetical protein B0T24DRAFT_252857 [Lasiosphaeria ovina]|uniref:Uncharacterized protein n=1 Tax=Lasiosphaeria ovina TaxID=92902 RepID=A0AAE0KBT9_9PEZI|nr:hypothetical protein B0T24DRAFT_252857 [Lasiosphaeria ovina]
MPHGHPACNEQTLASGLASFWRLASASAVFYEMPRGPASKPPTVLLAVDTEGSKRGLKMGTLVTVSPGSVLRETLGRDGGASSLTRLCLRLRGSRSSAEETYKRTRGCYFNRLLLVPSTTDYSENFFFSPCFSIQWPSCSTRKKKVESARSARSESDGPALAPLRFD